MRRSASYVVTLRPDEIAARCSEVAEIAEPLGFLVAALPEGFALRRTRTRPPYEDYEIAPLELRVRLRRLERGTEVHARTVATPRWSGIAAAIGEAFLHAGGSLVADLLALGMTRKRRAREAQELLTLFVRAMAPYELGPQTGPYRVPET
jgi:hypothetical protein